MLGSLSRGARLTGLVLALAAGLTGCTAGSRSTAAPPASAASTTRASTHSSATPSGTQARASNDLGGSRHHRHSLAWPAHRYRDRSHRHDPQLATAHPAVPHGRPHGPRRRPRAGRWTPQW